LGGEGDPRRWKEKAVTFSHLEKVSQTPKRPNPQYVMRGDDGESRTRGEKSKQFQRHGEKGRSRCNYPKGRNLGSHSSILKEETNEREKV